MKTRTRWVLMLLVAGLLAWTSGCKNGGASKSAVVGNRAPDFTVTDGGRTVTLHQLRGKPVLLHFWATWCPPCVEEMPKLVALQRQMGSKLTIVAISMDDDDAAFRAFQAKNMAGLLTVRDGAQQAARLYGTIAYPESYLIDADGKIVKKYMGSVDWNAPAVQQELSKL